MLLWIVLSGFFVAAMAPWVHRLIPKKSGWVLALLPFGLTLYFLSCFGSLSEKDVLRVSFSWIPFLKLNLSFLLDGLSLIFSLLITGIGTFVIIYAGDYFHGHKEQGRFYAYIMMFMASMLGVVLSDNMLAMFIFWELTSLTSYLLIGFDHERESARTAALQALLVTGAGGLAFMAGLLLLGQLYGDFELSRLLAKGPGPIMESPWGTVILILLLAGAFTKSAQFPFHFWLPSAMVAPTPVSTYLHAATMVKAGVYLVARISPLFADMPLWPWLVGGGGFVTMILGAILAIQKNDLKQILAYSTVSALGTLILMLGLGSETAVSAAMVYLIVHGLYKGTLFLITGVIDHNTGTRDRRYLGGLGRFMSITAAAGALAAFSMAGLPPSVGFMGKELLYATVINGDMTSILLTSAIIFSNIIFVAVALIVGIRPFIGPLVTEPKNNQKISMAMWLGPISLAVLGFGLGLIPSWLGESFIEKAAYAILQNDPGYHWASWHGLTPVFILSILTWMGGIGLFMIRNHVASLFERGSKLLHLFSPSRWYFYLLEGLLRFARYQTTIIQSGSLNIYIMMVILFTVVLTWLTIGLKGILNLSLFASDLHYYDLALGLIMILAALAAVRSTSRLATVIALGVIGYGVGLVYLFFGAPDLAMTQFLVETLTVIIFVLVFSKIPYFKILTRGSSHRTRDAFLAITVGALMTFLVLVEIKIPKHESLAAFFAENSLVKAKGHNIVNVILVDFRGLDTMGEITVLAVVAIGVLAMIKLGSPKEVEK